MRCFSLGADHQTASHTVLATGSRDGRNVGVVGWLIHDTWPRQLRRDHLRCLKEEPFFLASRLTRRIDEAGRMHKVHVALVEPGYYTRYPPLGLLKLAAYHKLRGDTVELLKGTTRPAKRPDRIHVTSLFTYAWKPVHESVKFFKSLFPLAPLTLGGIYASLLPSHASRPITSLRILDRWMRSY